MRRRAVAAEESGETNIPVKRRGHEGQIGHITRTYTPSSWTHTLHPVRVLLMPEVIRVYSGITFYTQRPLTLRASRCCTPALYGGERSSPNTLEQRNYRVSGASAPLLSLLLGHQRLVSPDQSTKSPAGVGFTQEDILLGLIYFTFLRHKGSNTGQRQCKYIEILRNFYLFWKCFFFC